MAIIPSLFRSGNHARSNFHKHQPLQSRRFNPSYFTPPATTLSAHQFRTRLARKARYQVSGETSLTRLGQASKVVQPAARPSQTSSSEVSTGMTKIRGLDVRYTWMRSSGSVPIDGPGPIPQDAKAGAIRSHRFGSDIQVWVLAPVKAIQSGRLHWVAATNGSAHPNLESYCLQVEGTRTPTWVTKSTLTTYGGRRRRREEKEKVNDDEMEDSDSPAPRRPSLKKSTRISLATS